VQAAGEKKRELEGAVEVLENRRTAVAAGLSQIARRLDSTVEQVEALG